MFGQRAAVAKAVLDKATKGKTIANDDSKALGELYYSISDCLTILKQLNYESDLKSSDTLRQVLQRLPTGLRIKWGEHSVKIKRYEEPNLTHLEVWLHARLLARKEAALTAPKDPPPKKELKKREESEFTGMNRDGPSCESCNGNHNFWKCKNYRKLNASKKWEFVKNLRKCFLCFEGGHVTTACPTSNQCFRCSKRHHTSLHGYYQQKEDSQSKGGNDSKQKADAKKDQKKDSKKETKKKEDDEPKTKLKEKKKPQ